MSTRAIIGYIQPNGTIVGGWQWNNGNGLAPLLRQQFNTIEKIQELIINGVWSTIITPNQKNDLLWFQERPDSYKIKKVGKCHIAIEPHHNSQNFVNNDKDIKVCKGALVFKDLITAYEQDINYLYIFNPKTNKWKTFGYKYNYEKLKAKISKLKPNEVINYIDIL